MSYPVFRRNTHSQDTGKYKGDSTFRKPKTSHRNDEDGGHVMHLIDHKRWWDIDDVMCVVRKYASDWPDDAGGPDEWTRTRVWNALCCAVWSGVIEVRDRSEVQS